VIVGGGPAAAAAAAALRAADFEGAVVLVGEEQVVPYERPPLSKAFLAGCVTGRVAGSTLAVRPREWYAEHDVELRLGARVERVDAQRHAVVLAGGERIGYDRLLLATGGRPRRLDAPSSDRVAYLRTVDDAEALAKRLRAAGRLVVLGGGFIGCEVAATARQLGVEVTVLELEDVPLRRALGERFGALVGQIHREAGVDLRTGERVRSVAEVQDGLLVTTDRARLECGMLLVAVGLRPSTEVVAGTGVRCENGILVDEYCRSTVPDIFAAGDVAAHRHPRYGRHIRVEHHDNAMRQGAVAARNMLGHAVAYDDPHWFWSDQYEHSLQSVGVRGPDDETVVRGSVPDRRFAVFSLSGGTVRSVFALNRGRDVIAGRRLIAAGVSVRAEELRDESVNLRRLAPPSGQARQDKRAAAGTPHDTEEPT
jgi:3-phenylpropionate/trans-cinnamate dioxygenase ferredoxin reductase subunit